MRNGNRSWVGMDRWALRGFFLLLALSALLVLGSGAVFSDAPPEGEEESTVHVVISPDTLVLQPGDLVTVTIEAGDVSEVFGIQYQLAFDPDQLEAWDTVTDLPATQVVEGNVFDGQGYYAAANSVDNGAGTIRYAAAIYDGDAVSGDVTLGQITFRAKAAGLGFLMFTGTEAPVRTSMEHEGAIVIPSAWHSAYVAVDVDVQRAWFPVALERSVE